MVQASTRNGREMLKSKAKREEEKEKTRQLLDKAQTLYREQIQLLESLHTFNWQETSPEAQIVPEDPRKLDDYILEVQKHNQKLQARVQEAGQKALEEVESKLGKDLEKIEEERLNFHQFDLRRYRQYLKLLKLAKHKQRRLQEVRYRLGLPHLTPFKDDEFYQEAYRLGRTEKVTQEAAEEALGSFLAKEPRNGALLNPTQKTLLKQYFESKVLLTLNAEKEDHPKDNNWKNFQLEGSGLYLVPVMILGDKPWSKATEVVSAYGLSEDEIKIIATLHGGEAYPTLKDAIEGAKAL